MSNFKCFRIKWLSEKIDLCFNKNISKFSTCKEISPGCSLEGMMLKLKLQYFGHLMRRVDSLEKTLMLGGIGGRRKRGQQRIRWHHWLNGYEFEWTPGAGDGQGGLVCCNSWDCKESDTTERLNWTELNTIVFIYFSVVSHYCNKKTIINY